MANANRSTKRSGGMSRERGRAAKAERVREVLRSRQVAVDHNLTVVIAGADATTGHTMDAVQEQGHSTRPR